MSSGLCCGTCKLINPRETYQRRTMSPKNPLARKKVLVQQPPRACNRLWPHREGPMVPLRLPGPMEFPILPMAPRGMEMTWDQQYRTPSRGTGSSTWAVFHTRLARTSAPFAKPLIPLEICEGLLLRPRRPTASSAWKELPPTNWESYSTSWAGVGQTASPRPSAMQRAPSSAGSSVSPADPADMPPPTLDAPQPYQARPRRTGT